MLLGAAVMASGSLDALWGLTPWTDPDVRSLPWCLNPKAEVYRGGEVGDFFLPGGTLYWIRFFLRSIYH